MSGKRTVYKYTVTIDRQKTTEQKETIFEQVVERYNPLPDVVAALNAKPVFVRSLAPKEPKGPRPLRPS